MGYPMTYTRLLNRNGLESIEGERDGYVERNIDKVQGPSRNPMIRGDLRRLEADTLDSAHLASYAAQSGATVEQVKKIFQNFFGSELAIPDARAAYAEEWHRLTHVWICGYKDKDGEYIEKILRSTRHANIWIRDQFLEEAKHHQQYLSEEIRTSKDGEGKYFNTIDRTIFFEVKRIEEIP